MRDVMKALRDLSISDSDINALVAGRVFVNRIPKKVIEDAPTFNPPKMLVLRQAGGSAKADFLPLDKPLVTALCYGESDLEADKVRRAVFERFDSLSMEESAGVLLHWINPTGGAIPLREPDIVWPAVAQTFSIMADVKGA